MEFREKQAIYMQIADFFGNNILEGQWKPDEKVPSVRQLAVEIEVNPNTIMRTYAHLQDHGIIYNKRGIGYFVSSNAKNILIEMTKQDFIQHELPEFFRKMELIGLTLQDIEKLFKDRKQQLNNQKLNNNEKDKQ